MLVLRMCDSGCACSAVENFNYYLAGRSLIYGIKAPSPLCMFLCTVYYLLQNLHQFKVLNICCLKVL